MTNFRVLGFATGVTLIGIAGRSDVSEQIPQASARQSVEPASPVTRELELLRQRIEELETAKRAHENATTTLNQRLEELEVAKIAHEDATRMLNRRLEELETARILPRDTARTRSPSVEQPSPTARKEATGIPAPKGEASQTANIAREDTIARVPPPTVVAPEKAPSPPKDATATVDASADTSRKEAAAGLAPRVEQSQASSVGSKDGRTLDQRVEELEKAKLAHEDATRTIIRQSFAERASNINDYVVFGGTLETLTFWSEDFNRFRESDIVLDTAELDFKIQVSDWLLGSLILAFDTATGGIFPTNVLGEVAGEALFVREAFITAGNTERFPLFGTFGRAVVPFGIATGDPVTATLTLIDPLTVEAFESRQDFLMFGFEMPTQPPLPLLATTPVPNIPVEPLLIKPLIRGFSDWLCSYVPCYPPPRKAAPPAVRPLTPAPFSGAVYVYRGATVGNQIGELGGTLGYRTKGLFADGRVPWAIDVDVDFTSSVFDSLFLSNEYQPFLGQIGRVPGMAGSLKSNLGPVAFLFEWNAAIRDATFADQGRPYSIRPNSWQVQLAYQFDFNPSVEVIAAQGTYLVINYSESEDLAGVTQLVDDIPTRIGFVPHKRINVGLGEWVLPTLRVALEYSHNIDYRVVDGGTGNSADGFFTQITYEW